MDFTPKNRRSKAFDQMTESSTPSAPDSVIWTCVREIALRRFLSRNYQEESMQAEDLRYALFTELKQAELHGLGYLGIDLQPLIRMQFVARAQHYAQRFPHAEERYLCSTKGDLVGRMLIERVSRSWCLIDMAVLKAFRNAGIATRALQDLCSEADGIGASISLKTFLHHGRSDMYQRLGVRVIYKDTLQVQMHRNPGVWQKQEARTALIRGAM